MAGTDLIVTGRRTRPGRFSSVRGRPVGARAPKGRRVLGKIVLYVLLTAIAIVMITPFVWMILTSLKTTEDIWASPPVFLPTEWAWENYPAALDAAPFLTYARNSLIIAVSHTAINLVIASMAGYALARLRFRGSEVVFMFFVAALMIPTYTKVIPEFLIVRFMPLFGGNDIFGQGGTGWLDTWWALIIPGAVTPFAVFLFRQFYLDLPVELEEAARIDGVSEVGIWARIMTPLVKPAFITVGLLTFESSWNNFLWPLLVTRSDDLRVIQVGLSVFRTENETQWAYLMAGTTLATLPMVALFLIGQKYFVRGFANAGIK